MPDDAIDAFLNAPSMQPVNNIRAATGTNAPSVPAIDPAAPPNIPAAEPDPFGLKKRNEAMRQASARPGVPLDTETGASAWEKFQLSFQREKATQVEFLQRKYPDAAIRQTTDGRLIVQTTDHETGKPKDLVIDEDKMHLKDFMSLAGTVPEIASGVISALAARKIPNIGKLKGLLGLQRDIGATAVGAEAAGAVKDVAADLSVRGKADVGQIAKERSLAVPVDVAIGEISMAIPKLWNFMRDPMKGSRGPLQFDAMAARDRLSQEFGPKVPLTVGEMTGNPLFGRTEVYAEKMPGGGSVFKEFKAKAEESLRSLQKMIMGTAPPLDESVGSDLLKAIESKVAPEKSAVGAAGQALQETATGNLEKLVGKLTTPEAQFMKSATGKEVREAVTAQRDVQKNIAAQLYDAVSKAPGGTGKVFDGATLQKDFQSILKKLPSAPQPGTSATSAQQPLTAFLPPNVLNHLQSVVSAKNPKFSLSDLVQMRRDIYEHMPRMQGAPGLGAHYLSDIGKAITKAIEDGAENMPSDFKTYQALSSKMSAALKSKDLDAFYEMQKQTEAIKNRNPVAPGMPPTADQDLGTLLKSANKHYRENVVPYNRVGLTELFRTPYEGGFVSDNEIVNRVFQGGKAVENYKLLKETVGNTPAFTKLKRAILDDVLEGSRDEISRAAGKNFIDPRSFIRSLQALRTQTPEIYTDIIGKKEDAFLKEALFADVGRGAKIEEADLARLMANPSTSRAKLKVFVDAQKKLDESYNNTIMKMVGEGNIPEGRLDPAEFVNRFLDAKSSRDVAQVMGLPSVSKDPNLLQDIRSKTIENMFRKASRAAEPVDIGKLMSGDPTRIVTGISVFKQMESPEVQKKLVSVLGQKTFDNLKDYALVEAAREGKEQAFKSAGGLAAGMQIAALMRHGPLRYAYAATKDWLVGKTLTSDTLRNWLGEISPKASLDPQWVSLALSSPVFLKEVAKDFPGAPGAMLVSDIKRSIDHYVREQASRIGVVQTQDEERSKTLNDFLESGPIGKSK